MAATKVLNIRQAGDAHQVVTIQSMNAPKDKQGGDDHATHTYRRRPCRKCPWRKDTVGEFPAEAFVHSAETAYDTATHQFACHASGTAKPQTCAGFLMRGSTHNLATRIARMSGSLKDDVTDGGHELFPSYRAMAIANGVPPDHPSLARCRDDV